MKLRRKNRKMKDDGFRTPSKRNNRAVPENASKFRKLTIFVYIGVAVVGFGYLAINKHVSTSGYELKGLENNQGELTQENKDIELKIIQLQSLAHLETISEELALKPSETVTYAGASKGTVALQD